MSAWKCRFDRRRPSPFRVRPKHADLGRHKGGFAPPLFQGASDKLLGASIKSGRVDEVYAFLERMQDAGYQLFVGMRAKDAREPHGAEAQPGHGARMAGEKRAIHGASRA